MSSATRFRRDALLVGITVVVCAAIFTPLTLGGSSGRQFTVWPGSSARFANMDWSCYYQPAGQSDAVVACTRESTYRGLRVFVTGDELQVESCVTASRCRTLVRRPRSP
jgi:hypothetical protein